MLKIMNLFRGAQLVFDHHLFQGIEPMPVIVVPVVLVAQGLGLANLLGQSGCPLRPSEYTFLMQLQGHGKRMRLPRFRENKALIHGRQWQTASALAGDVTQRELRRWRQQFSHHRTASK